MDFFTIILKRIEGFFKSLFSRIVSKLPKIKTLPQKIAKAAKSVLKDVISFLFKKPSQLADYIKLGNSYVAKRSLLWGTLLAAALVLAVVWIAVPFVKKTFFTARVVVNTDEFYTATGKAEVYTVSGKLLYAGDMENGVITGSGKVYDDGILIYQGDFLENEYNGMGKLFDKSGAMIYFGAFENSKYSGEGNLYYPSGGLMASGTFSENLLNGRAVMYDENGQLRYSGDFTAGAFNGKGELYDDGELKYSGDFSNGEMTGTGTLFENGEKVYSGGFLNGLYSGEGVLYGDKGSIRLSGTFEDGKASGACTIYGENGEQLFSGIMSDNGINYYSYISSNKSEVESSFKAASALRRLSDKELLYYSDLGAGFVFDEDGKTDRIIITGKDSLYGAHIGINPEKYAPPKEMVKYSSYDYTPTATDIKIMNYIGISEYDEMSCDKFMNDSVFIKFYCHNGKILFYEVGSV